MTTQPGSQSPRFIDPPSVYFGREICGELSGAEQREWLVTNGIGGFACGTVAGLLTRRYHGLLIAALKPPLGRTMLVAKLDETVEYAGESFSLSTNRWADRTISPRGYRHIEAFRLEGTTPVWTFALADALLEKRIWMPHGANATCVRYDLARASGPLRIRCKVLVNYRDYHSSTAAGNWRFTIEPVEHGLKIVAFESAVPYYVMCASSAVEQDHDWYRGFDLAVERYRGLPDRDDHLHAGSFSVELGPGESATVTAGTSPTTLTDPQATLETRKAYEGELLDKFDARQPASLPRPPHWIRQLAVAADQFIVRRPVSQDHEGYSVIAGYPWFGDWGRDTMISLPGLTLSLGRPEIARSILRTFAEYVDQGMLPNRFPDGTDGLEYNTADATLWYFEAVRQYFGATHDKELLNDLFPVLAEIIRWHLEGTRYQIRIDEKDGLLRAGEPGVQLTWMDAKVGDWVVTPRIGKPIEVNALWINALAAQIRFASLCGKPALEYEEMLAKARRSFQRFWNDGAGCCFDVIDGPEGDDASLRPNQIFAVSLPESALDSRQQRAVVDICGRRLLTSFGLRSLSPEDSRFVGRYGGDPLQRDGAYHQGTVWAWLLGPFVLAHLRVHNDPALAASFLEPVRHHISAQGLGSISEIFDGNPPFAPHGCIAQAWSVAEILRAWLATFGPGQSGPEGPVSEAE